MPLTCHPSWLLVIKGRLNANSAWDEFHCPMWTCRKPIRRQLVYYSRANQSGLCSTLLPIGGWSFRSRACDERNLRFHWPGAIGMLLLQQQQPPSPRPPHSAHACVCVRACQRACVRPPSPTARLLSTSKGAEKGRPDWKQLMLIFAYPRTPP